MIGLLFRQRAPFLFTIPRSHRAARPGVPASIVVVAAVFMPQAPCFLGTWQAGCKIALALFAVPEDTAFAFSILTWFVQMVVNVTLGGYLVSREEVSLRQLVHGTEPAPVVEGQP